jgi:hypothetical protein
MFEKTSKKLLDENFSLNLRLNDKKLNWLEHNKDFPEQLSTNSHSRSFGKLVPVNSNIFPSNPIQDSIFPRSLKASKQDQLNTQELFSTKKEIFEISEVFYSKPSKFKKNQKFKLKGFPQFFIDDHLNYRYQILKELGQGAFGTVFRCRDHKTKDLVAIKVLRKDPEVLNYGKNEITALTLLSRNEKETNIVSFQENFKFQGHLCLVFEELSVNLLDFLKKNHFQGFHLKFVKRVAFQVLIALRHSHSLGVVHCDLKPENIMLRNEKKSCLKVIDFGSAYCPGGRVYDYLQSRFYTAPEVILQAGWNEKIDIWSLGCVLVELCNGLPLFVGNDGFEVFCQMVRVLGDPVRVLGC